MDWPFTSFTTNLRERFKRELCNYAGVPINEMSGVEFVEGCTIFRARFDVHAVRYIVEMFSHYLGGKNDRGIAEIFSFFRRNHVTVVSPGPEESLPKQLVVDNFAPETPIIVFVHGWRGDSESFGEFPQYLSANTGLPYIIYSYPTGFWEKSPSMFFVARNLDNWIRNHAPKKKLLFIAHSMGGLVVRKLIVEQCHLDAPLDELVRQIVFIASPHSGTNWALLAQHVPFLRKAQLSELHADSSFLVELNEHWLKWTQRNIPKTCRVRSIYGTDDAIVAKASAIGADPDAIPMLNRDHLNIVEPRNAKDEVVITVQRLVRESGLSNK